MNIAIRFTANVFRIFGPNGVWLEIFDTAAEAFSFARGQGYLPSEIAYE